jgi:hypothetical protein
MLFTISNYSYFTKFHSNPRIMTMLNPQAIPFTSSVQCQATGKEEECKETVMSVPLPDGLTEKLERLFHPKNQKEELGNHLYPLISQTQPELAGKLTGMLLEMGTVNQLLQWLVSSVELSKAVKGAMLVLSSPDTQPSQPTVIADTIDTKTEQSQSHNTGNYVSSEVKQKDAFSCERAPHHSASLCIKNLDSKYNEIVIFERFDRVAQFAPISSIRVCRELGCAFVHFVSADDALRALVEVGAEFGVDEDDVIVETDLQYYM